MPEHLLDAAVRAIMGMNIGRSRAWAVLSAAAIKAILVHHLLDGQTMAKVAKMFKVTEGRISQIVTRYKSKAVEAVKDEIAPLCAWMN